LAEEEFAKVRTTRYRPDTLPPETRLMVFPDVVAQPGNAYVAWEGSDVWRHTATEKLQFSYRLNQGEWSEYLPAISHYFLKMASGAYTFEVRARDGDFNVDPTPARVDFRVLPPVWRQGWFQGLIGTVLVVLAIMEFRVIRRNYRLRIEVEERKRAQTTVEQQNQALGAQKQELEAQKDRLVAQKERLEQEVTQRKKAELEVEKAHKQLVDASRKAGMADVATGVLHNVGNVLNSVNVSANLIADKTKNSRISSLAKLDDLFSLHTDDLADFVARDAKGRQIPGFVKQLSEHLQQERAEVLGEVASLTRQIDHIKEIVVMQQDYARVSGVVETVDPRQLVEDALRIHGGAYDRHGVKVIREFQELPPVTVDKHKVLQILVNLLSNAKYACDAEAQADKQVWVRTEESDGRWRIVVRDNGVGLAPENLIRVFHQGFSLRKGGHGFGLHSSANAAKEMGGSLVAHSDGPGKGATFVLELPMQPSEEPAKADSFTRPADEHA
jgi:signal transduction histidine kinase